MKFELPKQVNLTTAFQGAAEKLRAMNVSEAASRTGAEAVECGLALNYFQEKIVIALPEITFLEPAVPMIEQILILHYLTGRENQPCSGELVQFKNLPGGSFYQSAYKKRGPDLILRQFGNAPDDLIAAGKALGGEVGSFGDASVELSVLPKVTATVVLYAGDEEFPPEAAILHPDSIINFLTLEDIALLGGMIYKRLKRCSS